MTPPEDQGNAGECVVSRVRWSAWPHRWDARGLTAVEPVASRGLGCAGPPNGRERGISAGGRVVTQAVERVATRVRCSAWPHRWGARGLSAGNMLPGDPRGVYGSFADDDFLSRLSGGLARARVASLWIPDPGEEMKIDFPAPAAAVRYGRTLELEHRLHLFLRSRK